MPETATNEFVAGADTHIPALDGPSETESTPEIADASPETVVEEQPETDAAADGQVEDSPSWATGDEKVDALIAQFSKEIKHLDPNNPEHFKTLKRLVDKELHIQTLQAKPPGEDDGLTEFEKSLRTPPPVQQQQFQPPVQPVAVRPQSQPLQGDGFAWKSPTEAYNDLSQAWTDALNNGDNRSYEKLHAVQEAIFDRQMGARIERDLLPAVEQLIQGRLDAAFKSQLGDVLPKVRQQLDADRVQSNREFALQQLQKLPEYQDVSALDKPDGQPPILVNGEQFESTPMNRILAENQWVMDIQVKGRNQDETERLTLLARFRAVSKLDKAGKIDQQQARGLLDAGKKMQARETQDGVRKGINRGPGTTKLSSGKGNSSYVKDLITETAGEMSFNSL